MSNAFVRQRFWQCGEYGYPDIHRGENCRPRCRATDRRRTVLVPHLFWYTLAGNWLVEATIASIVPLMWWGLLPALP